MGICCVTQEAQILCSMNFFFSYIFPFNMAPEMCFSCLSVYILSLKFSPLCQSHFQMFGCVCVCVQRIHLQWLRYTVSASVSVMSDSLQPHGLHVACLDPLSMEFSRQEDWSGLPFPSLGDLPDSGIKRSSQILAKGHLFSCLQSLPESLEKEI